MSIINILQNKVVVYYKAQEELDNFYTNEYNIETGTFSK